MSKMTDFTRIAARHSPEQLGEFASEYLTEFVLAINNQETRQEATRALERLFNRVGITDYCIVCDETNNTPDVVDANMLVVDYNVRYVGDDAWRHTQVQIRSLPSNFMDVEDVVDFGLDIRV